MATKDFEKDISQQTGFYAAVQKKTFTKWVNSHLGKVGLKVNDLYEDFRDGTKLLSLLEVLNDNKKKFKREKGKMKIHHVQNIQRALDFLEKDCKIKLVNIGSEEIVHGDAKLTLGLVWTLILHFQMSSVSSNQGGIGIKESLLKWVQSVVEGYDEVEVTNFHNSWKNGMAFCAVLDRHRPDLMDYESCDPSRPVENMNKAFQIAEEKFGIIRLLDPEDVAKAPEEKSIMTYVSYLYHQFPVTPPLRRKKGPAVSLADYTVIYTEMKRWLEEKIKQFKERKFRNDAKQVEALLAELQKFKDEELLEKTGKKQELVDTEKKLLAQKIDIPHILTMGEMDKLWSAMEQEMEGYDKALRDEMTKLQQLEDIAVNICKDCNDFPTRIAILAGHYKELVTGCEGKEFTVVTTEHQRLCSEIEGINKDIADINGRLKQLEDMKYYNIDTVKSRIKATTDQHRMVTNYTGILGRCVTELMWCLTQQHVECSRVYRHPDVTPESLSIRHQEFKAQLTNHDVPLIVNEAKQCISQKYSFANVIEVVSVVLESCWTVTLRCCDALKCHVEHYNRYCEFVITMEKTEKELTMIEESIDKHWNDASLPDAKKRDIIEACNDKVDKTMNKMKSLQDDCHDIYPYDLRVGPLPQDKMMVVPLCDCPQLQLEVGKEYKILGDITGKTKWKVSTPRASNGQLVCSTLLHIPPPSQWLTGLVEKNYSKCDRMSSMIAVRLEQAEQLDEADKVMQSLRELLSWLQPMVTQLDQQAPVGDTMEQVQLQCDWLRDCEDSVTRKQDQISHIFSVQLKLQSGPRLDEFNELKREFTIMWEGFNDKRAKWSSTLDITQRCFNSTAAAEASVRNQELWILRKGKPPKNQRVLQYIQDVKLFIEEDISKCGRAVEQMKNDYSQYTQSQGKDHDELRRKVDVISDHWAWLKRIINKYENQHKSIGSQTDKFDDEYQAHISWSADIVHYVNELPKLSVELEQLTQHKEELEEKSAEVRDKEGEVDNIQTSSRMFEASLQSVNEEYDSYRERLANCSSPVSVEESEIEKVIPSGSHDPSSNVQEGSIVDQATAVREQWQWIMDMLKQRMEHCDNLMKKLNSFEAKYSDNLAFIEEGEKLMAENHSPGDDPPVSQDPATFAVQLQKCLDFKQRKYHEQQKHTVMLEEGRKINELTYIDVDNDLSDRLHSIIDQWFDLGRAFDQWYKDMTEAQENFKQWDTQLKDFIDKLGACNGSNPLPTELEPSKLQSQVDRVQDTFLEHVWPLLEELKPSLDNLEANKANLTYPKQAEAAFDKYREVYETASQQKSELEQIKLRADDYAGPFESVSKWITESDRVLVKAKPLAALPVLVEEQVATIKAIEEELKEKVAMKEKLIEDTAFIAAQTHTVIPDKLNDVKEDFENTWKAIEDQVNVRRQKAGDGSDKLKECCSIMQPLEAWLKGAEEKAKQLSTVAKSRARLEKQSHDLKEFIDEVREQSTNVKATEDTKDQFVELAKDYEKTLEEYSMSPADLEERFTRMASITYAHNTKRPTSSAAELGRNVLSQDVMKLRQRYDKLLSALEKKWSKLQEINDKHVEVLKAAAEAEGSLDSIQQRKDDLVKQTNWAQPAVLQQHMLIAEDLRKECRTVEQGDVASLKRVYLDLEKARQDTPGEYSSITDTASDEDDAELCKMAVTDRLHSLEESLMATKNMLDKANSKLTAMNQSVNGFMLWLEDTERKLRNTSPDKVTLQAFEDVTGRCSAIADDVSDHKTQYDDITALINDYITEFGNIADIEDKRDNLIRRWNQLQEDLEKKQDAYEQEVEGLRVLEGKMAEYDEWLGEEDEKVAKLSPIAWSVDLLKQQKEETKALLDEMETRCEEDYEKGIHPQAIELITPYEELDCEEINKRISDEADKYDQLVGALSNRLNIIDGRSEAVSALLADQEESMTSLTKIDEGVDAIPVRSLSSADVDKSLKDLQALKDQFKDDRQKVDQVVKTCEQLTTAPSAHDGTYRRKSPTTDREVRESSVDLLESSVDAPPTAAEPATAQGEGLKQLQEAVQSLEEKCGKVEEKLRAKGVILADRLTAVDNFDKDFNTFHKELDYVVDELSRSQPVMNDDEAGKEQIEKTDKLVVEIQRMEPTLQLLSNNASLLLEGTDPDDQCTKSFEASIADEKKRYKDTLDSAMAINDMLKSESGKVQDVYKSLLPLKSWLTGQQEKMDAMRPAAVVSTPLSDQINENEQLGEEVRGREKDIEELKKAGGKLGASSAGHPIHQAVKDVTDQYERINDNVRSRANMLSQFEPRVSEHERLMEEFNDWLNDCCERVDQLPVADMAIDQLQSQLDEVKELRSEVDGKEPQCGVIKEQCDQLCNDPTDSVGNSVEPSVVTADYHPAADTARGHVSEMDKRVEELKKKLRDRENTLKKQEERVKKYQDAISEVIQWMDDKELQKVGYDLTAPEPLRIQEKVEAVKLAQEEQTKKQPLMDSVDTLLADVAANSSRDNPLKQQLEEDNEDLRRRWQQLANQLEDKQEALEDALRLAEKYRDERAAVDQWMKDTNDKLDALGPPPSNPKEAEKELNNIKTMRDEYEDMRPTQTSCCDTANSLAEKTTDPSVAKQLHTAVEQLQEEWQKLEDRLTEADNRLGEALGKASDLDRRLDDISDWLSEMLDKFNHLEPCAARAYLINDQISEAKATLEEIGSRAESIQVVQNIGQEVMSQCGPQDKNNIQIKLNQITTNFADVEEMAKLRLEELSKEKVKAEDYEKQASDLDNWLKEKEAIVEQWEELAIDSATLEQHLEKIGVFEDEVNKGYPVVTSLNDSEKTLLAADLETIRQYEKAFPTGPPEAISTASASAAAGGGKSSRRDSKELKTKDASAFKRKSSKRDKDKKAAESSVDKPQLPDFAKRQGAQEAVDEGKNLRKRYEDLKRSTDNRLVKVQDLLRQVQDYETALGNFGDWLREEKGTVNLIESFACTIEGINAELDKIKEAKDDFKKKTKDLEHLCKTGTALIDGCKVEESRKEAEQKLLETNNRWGDMLKSLDDKKQSLLAKQKEVEQYLKLLNQFCDWMSNVEKRLEEPVDLVGDPHKIADKLDEIKALAQEITDHKPELDTTVHSGKVAEYAGPAEEADSQPSRPQSGYSIAVKRYEDAVVACQDRIHQLEETLNKISEVKNDIEQLIESLNQCQSKISNTGRFRVKPDDAKAQLTSAKELNEEVEELQPTIEEKETTGQLFAVSPLVLAGATGSEGDHESSSPHHDEEAAGTGEDGEEDSGSKSPTPTAAVEEDNCHPTVPTGKSLKELLEQLAQLNSAVKELSSVKLKELENRLEKAEKFEQDYHDASEWFRAQQEELSNAGSVRGVPDGIKEQLAVHMEFQDMIEGKRAEVVALKKLAGELKEGVPQVDKEYLNEQLADLDNTVAVLARSCVKHQQELEEGLKRSNNFHEKLQKAIASVNKKKEGLGKISLANLDTPSVKAKLDELNAFQVSLKPVGSQVSEVMMLGQQLKDSCSDVDDEELDKRLKELSVLWSELNSDLQQRIQYLQGILLRLGQFHEDLGKFLTWIDDVESKLQTAPPPGVEPPAVEEKIKKLEATSEDMSSHHPELVSLFQAADELMKEANDPTDSKCDKLRKYKEDTEQRWNGLDDAMKKRRDQLGRALEKAEEFRVAFQQETLWLNSADDRLTAEWSPRGLPEKCQEEIGQHETFAVEAQGHNEPIKVLVPLGEGLKPQGSKAEKKMVDTWLKGLQDGLTELDKAMIVKKGHLETALKEAKRFEGSYQVMVQWVDVTTKAQEEVEPMKSDLDAVQNQLETHKATLKEVSGKEKELNVVMTRGQALNNKCVEEDGVVIAKLLEQLHAKWDHLNTLLTQRKTQLEEALLTLGQFQQAFDELWAWLTAIHEQLSQPHPISGKMDTVNTLITKHSAVQKQLGAKQSTHKAVGKAGKQLMSQKTGEDAKSLQKKLDELEQKWTEVCQLSANWQQKLERTRDELRQFNVLIVPLQKWLAKVNPRLSTSEPVYGNKETVERLIESHQQLQKELGAQNKKVEATKISGDTLVNELLDNPEPVKGSLELMSTRWDDACKASETRQNRLDQALLEAKLFEASYDDALEWVQIRSGHLASQLAPQEEAEALQQQIEEQKEFSAELLAKQPEIDKVLEKGEQILEEAHPDAVPILQNMIQELQDGWRELKKMASDRSEELATALLELQGVEEMLVQLWDWVEKARKKLATKQAEPVGDTLEEVETQLAEHESFQEDMAAQQPNMEALQKVARRRRGTGGNQDMIRKINDLHKKWQKLWLGATDRHRVLTDARMRLKDIAKARSFNYANWRQRFLDFSSQQKLRLNNLFIKFDANHDRKLNREEFINALKSSGLPMTRIELEKVADVFFPDRRALHLVDVSEIVAKLTQKHDWKKVENESDAVKIEREIQREISKCTCASRFKVEQIGEGKYRFGDSQRPYLVRILRTTVMVRVGGGWTTLTEFLQKHDPCRASTRTNFELYKEIRSKKTTGLDTLEFQSKVETKKKAKNEAVRKAAMEDPEAEVKTKILPSGRKATEISKRAVLEHGETKHVVEGTDTDVPSLQAKSRRQLKSSTVDAVPRQKHVLTKKLDREKIASPPRAIPTATGHLPHSAELHHKGGHSMIPRVGASPRSSAHPPQDKKSKGTPATSSDGSTKR